MKHLIIIKTTVVEVSKMDKNGKWLSDVQIFYE